MHAVLFVCRKGKIKILKLSNNGPMHKLVLKERCWNGPERKIALKEMLGNGPNRKLALK